jgi:hypothetical protein
MSGSTIGGIVGGIVGFVVSDFNPAGFAYGYSIGAAIGGYVDPAPGAHTYGPQLSDLSAQSANYGSPIARIIGRGRVAGNLIYCQTAQKHTHTQGGGKGSSSPTVTTYSYTRTFAVALCEGEAAVLRVWVGGKLVYDASSADPATLMAQVTGNDVVTIYPGSETQMPDADIAAAMAGSGTPAPVAPGSYQSAGATPVAVLLPAFRGTCYLVFPDYDVTDYGGYTAPIAAEVVSKGSMTKTVLHGPFDGGAADGSGQLVGVKDGGITRWGSIISSSFAYAERVGETLVRSMGPYNAGMYYLSIAGDYVYGRYSSGYYQRQLLTDPYPSFSSVGFGTYSATFKDSGQGVVFAFDPHAPSRVWAMANGEVRKKTVSYQSIVEFVSGTWIDGQPVSVLLDSPSGGTPTIHVLDEWLNLIAESHDLIENMQNIVDGKITVMHGSLITEYTWNGTQFAQSLSIDTGNVVLNTWYVYTIERARRYLIWKMIGGVVQFYIYNASAVVSTTDTTAEAVILALTAEGGLTSSDVDASACAGITFPGYARTKVTTPRAALQPLLQAFQIDAIESGATYKFVPRGQGAVITVDPLDLGCFDEGGTPPSELQSTRTQAAELPRQVTITYQDTTRDCQSGSQIVRRLDAPYSGVVNMQFPGLLTPDQAAQIADVTLRTSWRERMQRSLQLPHTYLRVEPGDILQWAGYQMRVTRTDGVVPGTIKLQALDEYPADYSSAATGMTVASASALAVSGPTDLLVLDIPALRDADATHPGLYLAACGYLSGWRGCALQRSADGGASWTQFGAIGLPGVVGQTVDALGAGPTTIVDRGNSVTVRLFSGVGSLAGITEADLLAGLNTMVIGSELVGVQNVTLNTDGTYTLDTFLRGRYGTEDGVATHQAGERVMLVTGQGWVRQDESASSLGAVLEYRAPSAGQYGEQADVKSITFAARSSKPWSPCHLTLAHKSNGDRLLTWVRRTRLQTSFQAGIAPLGEDSEQYDVELIDSTGAVVRTVSALTSPSYTYTAADQTTDGNAAVSFRVYQISATVGRGMPAEAAL